MNRIEVRHILAAVGVIALVFSAWALWCLTAIALGAGLGGVR